jgi:hypothetical protein
MYRTPSGLPPIDPELAARHSRRASFHERFGGTLIALGALIALLVVLSVIGRLFS